MEISSNYVGLKSNPYQTSITWRRTTNFAAGVADNNPVYFDDERPEGIIAPPMLVTAITWPISRNINGFWHTDLDETLFYRQVHFNEQIVWHRPMRPGDELSITGELASIGPCRGGSLLVVRYEALDADGKIVFEEYTGALLRGVRCPEGLRTTVTLPKVHDPCIKADPIWEQTVRIDPLASYVYDGCADNTFPIHTSPRFARSVGLPGIIIHGTHTLTLAVRELANREADGDPTRLASVRCTFTGMVLPGTDIRVRVLDRKRDGNDTVIFFDVLNADAKKALSDAYIVVRG